ncbi:MAG: hypothetical protein EU532_11660 [Promethearchaeota archaeon]|nr:MAG: hypothetical protein EU532_11660 [Candidatus Lokiarchaeota archaeon]
MKSKGFKSNHLLFFSLKKLIFRINLNFRKYIEFKKGSIPVVLSCPHGGFLKPPFIPNKLKGSQLADKNKYLISKRIIQELNRRKTRPYYILSKIHRSKIDFNRPARSHDAYNHESIDAKKIHEYYHQIIIEFYEESVSLYNRCLFIDLHGFTKPHIDYPDIIFGNIFGKTLKIRNDSKAKDLVEYWGFSDMVQQFSRHFTLDDGLGITNFNLAYSGGYITHQFYKKNKVNAFQLEVAKYIRENRELTKKFVEIFVENIIQSLAK